ncbi:MAG: hypothetical protein Kow0075_04400 [Salibacteraceae bacterium]
MSSYAQGDGNPIANKGYYRTQNIFGADLHTRGSGIYFKRGWRQTGFVNHIMNVELQSLRHPKEFKINNPRQQNSRGYYYGKINSVMMLRGSYGKQKTLFDKEVKRGVRVSQYLLGGPTVAFLKPVYLEIEVSTGDYRRSKTETIRATETTYTDYPLTDIFGRAPILTGIEKTTIVPGGHIKYALSFEYSDDDSIIRAIETGVNFDIFAQRLPIMAQTYNDQFYLTFYVGVHFGKRYL